MFRLISILVRWQGKMAEHSFFLDFFVSFFVKEKRKERNLKPGKFSMTRLLGITLE
jgi:hypothetical protein